MTASEQLQEKLVGMPGILSLIRTPQAVKSRRWLQFGCNYVLLAPLTPLHTSSGAAVVCQADCMEVVSISAVVCFAGVIAWQLQLLDFETSGVTSSGGAEGVWHPAVPLTWGCQVYTCCNLYQFGFPCSSQPCASLCGSSCVIPYPFSAFNLSRWISV